MKEWITFLLGMAPISELRGAIPFGLSVGLSLKKTLFLSVTGNILPIIPLLLFLEGISQWLIKNSRLFNKFFKWLFKHTRRHSALIERYETLGLFIIASIPLPMFGSWSGCAVAFIFGLPFWRSFLLISLGVLVAAVIVTSVVLGLVNLGQLGSLMVK